MNKLRFTQEKMDNIGYVIWDNNHNTNLDYDVICQYLNDWSKQYKEIKSKDEQIKILEEALGLFDCDMSIVTEDEMIKKINCARQALAKLKEMIGEK